MNAFNYLNDTPTAKFTLKGLKGKREVQATVDSGASKSLIPVPMAIDLGLKLKEVVDVAVGLADKILSSARRVVDDPPRAVDNLAETLRRVLKDRVRLAFIFGSQVKGYSLKGDVDVALYFGRRPDPYEVGGLVSDIQESLGREDVDVLVIDVCDSIALAYEAVQGKPILGKEAEILQLKTKIASQCMDYNEKLNKVKALLAKG